MTTILPFYQVFMDVYHLILSSWNACLVLLQVIWLTVNEAQQEVAQLMEMLDDGDPVMSRVLHLEVDKRITMPSFSFPTSDSGAHIHNGSQNTKSAINENQDTKSGRQYVVVANEQLAIGPDKYAMKEGGPAESHVHCSTGMILREQIKEVDNQRHETDSNHAPEFDDNSNGDDEWLPEDGAQAEHDENTGTCLATPPE
ncbi:hypothetical protein PAXINDRAFT_152543 [Paxillus involutus ATCC 200175]|nr:hypothetical protein PAXINDRAFT_152543 [Paxillus involutus ATCC 200175]